MNEERKKALQSLKTAKGQIDGIIKMIEEERYCMDISNQIVAAQALESFIFKTTFKSLCETGCYKR